MFAACARTGTAVEINSRPERQDPPEDLLRQAVDARLLVLASTPTPTHRASSAGSAGAVATPSMAEVPFDRIVNRGTADDLLAWASAHAEAA